jgi:D-galactonate transporter
MSPSRFTGDAGSRDSAGGAAFEAATYRKVTWRLMPFLFLCYILAYIDRVNVGFAKLQMQQDLPMSDAVYGAGAGILFVGYFFFEVPSNMLMQRLGARRLLGPIMIIWGMVCACMMFVRSELSFYVLRFLLGAVESGFFPGVILYLTFWYTTKHRVRMVAAFMSAIPLSGIVAGPISGWILQALNGTAHLSGWQWLFLLTGVPSSIMGLVTLYFLTDTPAQAKWLTEEEKRLVLGRLQDEEAAKKQAGAGQHRLVDAFRSVDVWLMCLIYFGLTAGNYGIGFWLPQVIKETISKDPVTIGWLYALPWVFTVAAMFVVGHHSDKTGERRWHLTLCSVASAAAFVVSAIPGIPGAAGLAALTVATAGILCGFTLFWAIPTALLSGTAAAAGIAWINSVGNLAGYFGPYAVGAIRDRTHSMTPALAVLAGAQLGAAVITLVVTRKRTR